MSGAGQAAESSGYSYESGEQPDRACRATGPVSQAVLNELIQMQRSRQVGATSSFEPISTDMVEAALCRVFSPTPTQTGTKQGNKPGWLRPLAEQVARTLREDATAGPRMQAFWDQIQSHAGAGSE